MRTMRPAIVHVVFAVLFGASPIAVSDVAAAPSLDCAKAVGSVDEVVCKDPALGALDTKLVDVYAASSKAATAEQKNRLAADQQQWLVMREACNKATDRNGCVKERYTRRIADLQAQFKLVPSRGPFRFACNEAQSGPFVAQYFETDPPTARFTFDGRTVTAFIARSGSGARYDGPSVSYWEHQGEASVVWFGRTIKCSTRS
jgi:uncharacterized protein